MHVSFSEVLDQLGEGFELRIMNEVRRENEYLFNNWLPERTRSTYSIDGGSLKILPAMAGLVGMDSAYPPGGVMTSEQFLQETAKLAASVPFPEKMLREVQRIATVRRANGGNVRDYLADVILNFTDKVLRQGQMDTMEWLRAQAIIFGQIDWQYGDIRLTVDYQMDPDHYFATRTITSGDAYGEAGSVFWTDHRTAYRLLKGRVDEIAMHPDTYYEIISNDANNAEVVREEGDVRVIRRLVGSNERQSQDRRDTVTIRLYATEGSVIDPNNPETTKDFPFLPAGYVVYKGRPSNRGFSLDYIGEGATPDEQGELGYTHIAPTTEDGSMQGGRWARVYTPERRPMQLKGDTVTNGIPVLTEDDMLVVASTEMS